MPQPKITAPAGKYIGSVKVGSKGQIVIPKEARDLFKIQPGDLLLLMADVDQGIAIQRFEAFEEFAKEIFQAGQNPQEIDE